MIVSLVLGLCSADYSAEAAQSPHSEPSRPARLSAPSRLPWQAVRRTGTETHWQTVTFRTNTVTGKLVTYTNFYVELGSHLNVPAANGAMVSADPGFQITATGAEARRTAHQVFVPADIANGEGLRIVTPRGQAMTLHPLGLGYFDPTDGRSVLLDVVTNAVGWQTAANEIVFSNCFTRLKASIRIQNTRSGLEHDIILHERPEGPAAFGLSSAARLEMLTEQLAGPTPGERKKFLRQETDRTKLATMLDAHFVDADLQFDGMRMITGKAFSTGRHTNKVATVPSPVGKSYWSIDGRRVLIEAVEHQRVAPALEKLPLATNGAPRQAGVPVGGGHIPRLAQHGRHIPSIASSPGGESLDQRTAAIRRTDAFRSRTGSVGLLASAAGSSAFVLDYELLSDVGETNYVFRGNTTYLIDNPIPLYGTTTIEGGAVLKFYGLGGLEIMPGGSVVCDTTPYLPAVFTSWEDDSVGEIIADSSGVPSQIYDYFINLHGGTHELRHLRFSHIYTGISAEDGTSLTLRHVQFRDAYVGVWSYGTCAINAFNALCRNVGYLYVGDTTTFRGEHITAHGGTVLAYTYNPGGSTALLRNSLLVGLDYPPEYSGALTTQAVVQATSGTGIFQTLEGGAHYLPLDSRYRGMAATNIDPVLARDLADMTTYAPAVLTGTLGTDTALWPVLSRDVATLGYHYPAVDYLTRDLTLLNATLTLRGGVVVATAFTNHNNWTSIQLSPGKLISIGTPVRMNRLLRAQQVQENPLLRGETMVNDGFPDEFKPEVVLRFTDVSCLAGELYLLVLYQDFARFEASHCQFAHGYFTANHYGGSQQTTGLTNNLFRRVFAQIQATSPANFHAYNNTFRSGTFLLTGGHQAWRVQFNLFDQAAVIRDASPWTGDENAYVGMSPKLNEDGYVQLPSLAYATGPLGDSYLPDNTLRNLGSLSAAALGLYHFTTATNQAKEASSAVDFGFHYAAVTQYGNGEVDAADTDFDGVADYREDANGDGDLDAGETSIHAAYTAAPRRDVLVADDMPPIIHLAMNRQAHTGQPLLQVIGHCDEPLQGIAYALWTNSSLATTGLGFTVAQRYDTNRHRIVRQDFQCFDLRLWPGTNDIFVTAIDLAGNRFTNQLTYVLDPDLSVPPEINVRWPLVDVPLGADKFSIRGQLSDPSASVRATIPTATGVTDVAGQVERNGAFWIDDLVLASGSAQVTVTATSAFGASSTSVITVTRGALSLAVAPAAISTAVRDRGVGTVAGSLSAPGYEVWVNGVQATVGPDGAGGYVWSASGVTAGTDGTGILEMKAFAAGNTTGLPVAQARYYWIRPTVSYCVEERQSEYYDNGSEGPEVWTLAWNSGAGGGYFVAGTVGDFRCQTSWRWNANHQVQDFLKTCDNGWVGTDPGPGTLTAAIGNPPYGASGRAYDATRFCLWPDGEVGVYRRSGRTVYRVAVGGRAIPERSMLVRAHMYQPTAKTFNGSLDQPTCVYEEQTDPAGGLVPPGQVSVLSAGLDRDYAAFVPLPQGAVLDPTPTVARENYTYTLNVSDVNPIVAFHGSVSEPLPSDELAKDVLGDPARPGEIIFANNGDVNGDGVPNFADGFDKFGNEGSLAGGDFETVQIYLPPGINCDRARLIFLYSASAPDQVATNLNADGTCTYTPAGGKIRLWRVSGQGNRVISRDYLVPGQIYEAHELGFDNVTTRSRTLYVEGIAHSAIPGDVRIEVFVDPDGELDPAQFVGFDAARMTVLKNQLVRVNDDDSITPVTKIETSHASPVISVNALAVSDVGSPAPDFGSITGRVAIAGSIACDSCDVYPDGRVDEVRVFINSYDTPAAVIPVNGTKGSNPGSLRHRYPFSGTFATNIAAELELGVNLIRVVAVDNVTGIAGYSEWTVEVTGQYHAPFSLSFTPVGYSSGSVPNALSAQLSLPDGSAVSATLVSTPGSPNTFSGNTPISFNSFIGAGVGGGLFTLVFDQLLGLNDTFVDLYSGNVVSNELGLPVSPFVGVEGGASSRSFVHDGTLLPSWLNWTFQPGQASHLQSSTGGQGFWHALNVLGPAAFLDRIKKATLSNSYGEVQSERTLYKAADGQFFIGNLLTNHLGPAMIFSCPVRNIANSLGWAIAGDTSQLDYNAGFAVGFAKGFGSLVEGTLHTAAVWGPNMGLLYQGERLQDIRTGLNLLVTSWAAQEAIKQFFIEWRVRQLSDIYSTTPSPGEAALKVLSEDGRLMAEFCKELIIFLNQHAPGNTYDAGKLHGRVAFEVASLLVAELKAGQLASMSKVSFYTKIEARLTPPPLPFPEAEAARAAAAAAKVHVSTGLNRFKRAAEFGIQPFKDLPVLHPEFHRHHLIEQRFWRQMGQHPDDMLCIVLTPEEHLVFTRQWRQKIPRGTGTANASRTEIEQAAREIYADFPEILQALGL